jgi:4-amino-4-deoxy-L-arabinose transferase-like glycosyltransferase
MSAVRSPLRAPEDPPGGARRAGPGERAGDEGRVWLPALAAVLAVALGLRLWGVRHGMPFAYNVDENAHFVTNAIGFFGHSLNPGYFINPPAYTYLLHVVFAIGFGGREGVHASYAESPAELFTVARVVSGLLGTLTVALLYLAGARLWDRRVGVLAAALGAVAFLPVFYSHLALNDVPALAPLTLVLVAVAGLLRRPRRIHYVLGGLGLGLACATKYTAGIVVLPLLTAMAIVAVEERRAPAAPQRRTGPRPLPWALAALALSGLAFFAANPYAFFDFETFWNGLVHQSTASSDELGKVGLVEDSGIRYYLWTLTWGLGYVPAAVAALGAVMLAWRNPRLAIVLIPAPIVFILFMSAQQRYFGRWLMPILPILILLASWAAVRLLDALPVRRRRLRLALGAAAVALLVGQGLVSSVHSSLVLSREDTRNLVRAWMVENIPPGTKIVVEPTVPDQWVHDPGNPSAATPSGNRWVKFLTSRSTIKRDGTRTRDSRGRVVNVEDYVRTLRPALVDSYERGGYCWVIRGSTQAGRAFAAPDEVPRAVSYYSELKRRADLVHVSSPYREGWGPISFNFDWSFNYYPLAYERPGGEMRVYRLRGGRCAK